MIYRNPNMFYFIPELDKKECIIFDLETSGLNPKEDRIIQIAAIKIRKEREELKEIDRLNVYISPDFLITPKIEKLTGITNQFLKKERKEEDVFSQIFNFFGNVPLCCGYNINFDIGFMKELYHRHNEIFICPIALDILSMARDFIPYKDIKSYKLGKVIEFYGLHEDLTFHNAMDDVIGTYRLLKIFIKKYKEEYSLPLGHLQPKIFNFFTWQGKRHDLARIYFCTNIGNIYYDIYHYCWGAKEINMEDINLPYLAKQVYQISHTETDDELYYWAKKQIKSASS